MSTYMQYNTNITGITSRTANSSIDLKIKEAFYKSKNKPDLNKQLHHFNTFLTLLTPVSLFCNEYFY